MEEKELLLKIENLEKRVSILEKQLETISQINQSEKVKEYIASAEKASKIAKLLDVAAEKNPNDSQIENIAISDVLSSSPIMEKIDTAKEFVVGIDSNVEMQIRENNDEANKYDWDTLFDYEEVDGQITIKSYIGFDDLDVVVIPDRINNLSVTKIGEKAFENCKGVKEVILPKGLKIIGECAFQFSGISSIILPESLKIIGEHAFSFSGISSIILPESLSVIEYGAFSGTKLDSIHIPSSINSIESLTFCACTELKWVSLANGITSIDSYAFDGCENLKKIDIPKSIKVIGSEAFHNIGECNIRISNDCMNMDDDAFDLDATIYCNAGSTAMKYARKFGITVKRYEEFDLLEE